MTAPTRFVVVGDVMVDVLVRVQGQIAHGSDTPAVVTTHGGGAGANTARWLAAGDHEVALLARIGADLSGERTREDLRRAGIDARLAVDRHLGTGTCVVLVHPDGERTMLPDAGANAALDIADIPAGIFDERTHLQLSGYPVLRPSARAAALAALAAARAAGATVGVDAASAQPLTAMGPAAFLTAVRGIDVLLANLDEATVLTGHQDAEEAAQALAEHLSCVVVIKLGRRGALLCRPGASVLIMGTEPVEAPESTGAGDAFAAGFVPVWRRGGDDAAALAAGNMLARRAVAGPGASPS